MYARLPHQGLSTRMRLELSRLQVTPRVSLFLCLGVCHAVEDVLAHVIPCFFFDVGRNDTCCAGAIIGKHLHMPVIISPGCGGHAILQRGTSNTPWSVVVFFLHLKSDLSNIHCLSFKQLEHSVNFPGVLKQGARRASE